MSMVKINSLKGYENVSDIYMVSDDGNIYSNSIIRKPRIKNNGYLQIDLYQTNHIIKDIKKYKKASIHRLVALAFIPNPDNLPEVNHKDEIKSHNWKDNLEWCNRNYNMNYGTVKKRISEVRSNSECFVYDYRLKFCGRFNSYTEALNTIYGRSSSKGINKRINNHFFISQNDIELIPLINSDKKTLILRDTTNNKTLLFPTNRSLRRYFHNQVNVTQALKRGTIYGKYKVAIVDYSKLIRTPSLKEYEF